MLMGVKNKKMRSTKLLLRVLFIPAMLFLGACGCEDIIVPPSSQPVEAPISPLVDVYFDYNKTEFSADAVEQLKANANWILANSARTVIIEGHCDERGTNEYNLALGERRAKLIKDYIVNLGVSPANLKAVSYGEERPFEIGSTEEAWAQNRRVHFISE